MVGGIQVVWDMYLLIMETPGAVVVVMEAEVGVEDLTITGSMEVEVEILFPGI